MIKNNIWFYNNDDWIKATLNHTINDNYIVNYQDKTLTINKKFVHIRNHDDIDTSDNLIDIPHLNEPSILNGISIRYINDTIYTYTGNILIAVNPFKFIDIYSDKFIDKYKNSNNNLKPHAYKIAYNSFRNLTTFNKNQSILISGESGAGKTHTTKVIMNFLTKLSGNNSIIEKKIIDSNPILESFGNAKTIRNHNSSRFGKFIKLLYSDDYKLIGASINSYLLEKIRIIHQNENERNFHIFYQLMAGLTSEQKNKYFLNYKFNILNFVDDDNLDDLLDFNNTINAFHILNFSDSDIDNIFKITSAILNLGNVQFNNNKIIDISYVNNVSSLLNTNPDLLIEALCFKNLDVGDESYKIDLKQNECIYARDCLSMTLYQNMFNWIVNKINLSLETKSSKFIGILDIFGFESFKQNNFEQLCINYTNENLQQQFNKYVFKLEQIEYEKEKINWEMIQFPDNQKCLDLIHSKNGIFKMLDEECMLPKGSDSSFNRKLNKKFYNHPFFSTKKINADQFLGIKHYAGEIFYSTKLFCNKNMNLISPEIFNFIKSINFPQTFCNDNDINFSRIKLKSVVHNFKTQLNILLKSIDLTDTHYIRCLKPNDLNKPNIFDRKLITSQLRYCGVLEAIRVARAGYPIRFKFSDFIDRYRVIDSNPDLNSNQILNLLDKNRFQLGLTKIFLKNDSYILIEEIRKNKLNLIAKLIQKNIRMFLQFKKYKFILNKIIILQNFNRIIISKNILLNLKKNKFALLLQTNFRSFVIRNKYLNILSSIKIIQKIFRNFSLNKKKFYSIVIQKYYRSYIIKKKYLNLIKNICIIQKHVRIFLKNNKHLKKLNDNLIKNIKLKDNFINQKNNEIFSLINTLENKDLQIKQTKSIVNNLSNQLNTTKQSINEHKYVINDLENELNEKDDYIHNIKNQLNFKNESVKKKDNQLNNLNNDLLLYKECINKNVSDKIEMASKLELLLRENERIKRELERRNSWWSNFSSLNFFGNNK